MKYLSIDLETTGLDPDRCDVIEFAAVLDDTMKPEVPIDQLPSFRALLVQDIYKGEPYALAMHKELLNEVCGRGAFASSARSELAHDGGVITNGGTAVSYQLRPFDLFSEFEHWLVNVGMLKLQDIPRIRLDGKQPRILVAGKNFAGFDLRFLRRMAGNWDRLFSHRVLDPAMMFIRADDEKPPSLEQCLGRAGFSDGVTHTALNDARDVVRCIRGGFAKSAERVAPEKRLRACEACKGPGPTLWNDYAGRYLCSRCATPED